jgi:nucleotidyltransferase/DNA polymerase involved in DNA repair
VRLLAPQIEDRVIDEIFIDFTGQVVGTADACAWTRARRLAIDIQRAVREATGLSCSIGVTPNKLLSKIASDLEKPGGITVLSEDDIAGRVWPLPARRINGIGPKANARLEALGIRTIGELARADLDGVEAAPGNGEQGLDELGVLGGRVAVDVGRVVVDRPLDGVRHPGVGPGRLDALAQ